MNAEFENSDHLNEGSESQCLMKSLLSCTDINFLGDLDEGIEKNAKGHCERS